MKTTLLASWNVNGMRSVASKGFFFWLQEFAPKVCFLQETKARREDLDKTILEPSGYVSHFVSGEKRGYSGVGAYIKKNHPVDDIRAGLGIPEFDREGRVITVFAEGCAFVNCYFPNSQRTHERLPVKLAFNKALHEYCDGMRKKGLGVVICGDFNVAHHEIDLRNPKSNVDNAGFLPQEREWMTHFLSSGYVDSFRHLNPDLKDQYTWWSYRPGIREKNIGWRIDYFVVSEDLVKRVHRAAIHPEVRGSDHCPVSLCLK